MSFCPHCDHSVYDGAKFCPECGKSLTQVQPQMQRKKVFEGDIHICPHCSEPLSAFDLVCPACGREIRNRKVSTAVQQFANEIAELEAERTSPFIPTSEGAENGKLSRNARRRAREQIDRKIASRIQNFPIPNTKEDLFEFLILSLSNISEDRYSDRISKGQKTISDAWKSKSEQAYQKARTSFGKTPEFGEIKAIYEEKRKNEEQIRKIEDRNKRRVERRESVHTVSMVVGLFALLFVELAVFTFLGSMTDKEVKAEN